MSRAQQFATLILLCTAGMAPLSVQAQTDYLYEMGLGGGVSFAYGDINRSKPLYKPSLGGSLLFRYTPNLRWAFTAELASLGIQGDSRDFDNQYPQGMYYQVDRRYWQLSACPEINFWNYGWGNDFREKKRLVPFLTAGLAIGLATGQDDNAVAVSIPMGLGLKYKITPRLNTQLTARFYKVLGDGLDGVSDPYGVNPGALVGTDWLSSLMLSVTFDFGERCIKCNKD